MNALDLNVQMALDHGLVLTAVEPRLKNWIDLNPIDTFAGWRAAQATHGNNINAAVHLNPSDLCILDLDTWDALTVLTEHVTLPPTMTVRTARGLHLYFRRGMCFGDSGEIWVGEEHLGQYLCGNLLSHYALLPGSFHPSGIFYSWLRDPRKGIADMLPELHDWVRHDSQPYEDFDSDWDE